jgi:hypothetical protein
MHRGHHEPNNEGTLDECAGQVKGKESSAPRMIAATAGAQACFTSIIRSASRYAIVLPNRRLAGEGPRFCSVADTLDEIFVTLCHHEGTRAAVECLQAWVLRMCEEENCRVSNNAQRHPERSSIISPRTS